MTSKATGANTSVDVFASLRKKAWPHTFEVALLGTTPIAAGTPSDPDTIKSWIKTSLGRATGQASEEQIRVRFVETLEGLGIDDPVNASDEQIEEAIAKTGTDLKLNVFKRDDRGLFMEGRHAKACLREGASVAMAADLIKIGGWGKTNKGLLSFLDEHVFIPDTKLHLGADVADGTETRFIPKYLPGRGKVTAIHTHQRLDDWKVTFTVQSDWDFTPDQWGFVWIKAGDGGLGASRSQGFGRFVVTRFEEV